MNETRHSRFDRERRLIAFAMNARIALLILLAGSSLAARAAVTAPEIEIAVAALRNADVEWHGNIAGVMPSLTPTALEVLGFGDAARPSLLKALERDCSFVVAHVLLTRLSFVSVSLSGGEWNRLCVSLRVDRFGNAEVIIDPAQRVGLVRFWQARERGSPE